MFTQKSTCLFVCWLAFFLRSPCDRCQIVTVTCKTNVSSLLGINHSFHSPLYLPPINNKFQRRHIDIGRNKEVIHCTLAKQFFQLIQNFRSCRLLSEKTMFVRSRSMTTVSHLFSQICLFHRLTSLLLENTVEFH